MSKLKTPQPVTQALTTPPPQVEAICTSLASPAPDEDADDWGTKLTPELKAYLQEKHWGGAMLAERLYPSKARPVRSGMHDKITLLLQI